MHVFYFLRESKVNLNVFKSKELEREHAKDSNKINTIFIEQFYYFLSLLKINNNNCPFVSFLQLTFITICEI